MEFSQLLKSLNWVDWGVLLILLFTLTAGMGRGFLLGALDLLALGAGLVAAAAGYRPAADFIVGLVHVHPSLAILVAFISLFLLIEVIYSALLDLLVRPLWLFLGPGRLLDSVLGIVPGTISGLVFSTILLLPFATLTVSQEVSASIERSAIGSKLVSAAINFVPAVDSLMGRDLDEALSFLTPPQTEEGWNIKFGQLGQLTPDPDSEQRMLELINLERAKAGLGPLSFDEQLREVARSHSLEMFQLNYFSHTSPVTGSPADRAGQAGIPFLAFGENLAYAPNVYIAHEGLMNSPGHKANILDPRYGRVGIGVIKSQYRGSMFTQNFRN